MSLAAPTGGTLGSVPNTSGLLSSTAKQLPTNVSWRPILWLIVSFLLGAAFLFGGVEAGTILVAGMIAVLALSKPRSALWATTAFMIYLCVFFQKESLIRTELPFEFYYWGAGVAIITLGLGMARMRLHPKPKSSTSTKHQIRFDRAMYMIFVVSLAASGYGLARGNSFLVVARQLSGCLLLPVYYWLGKSYLRTVEDIAHWLRCVSWVVVAGAGWYAAKLSYISFSEGEFYREQSPLSFYAGAAGAVFFVELLQAQRWGDRIRNAAGFAVCGLAVVLMGARVNAGSLAATAIVFAVLRWKTRRLGMRVLTLVIVAVAIPFGVTAFEKLLEAPGVIGGVASRFSPFQLDEDLSYIGRAAQLQAVGDVIQQHPFLGAGMGSELPSFTVGWAEMYTTAYIDNGWGYLLLKMGLVGLAVFLVLIGSFLRCATERDSRTGPGSSTSVRRCLVALILYGLFGFTGGPSFFHFTSSGFLGTALGGLATLTGESARIDGVSK